MEYIQVVRQADQGKEITDLSFRGAHANLDRQPDAFLPARLKKHKKGVDTPC